MQKVSKGGGYRTPTKKSNRGFASMSPSRRREVAAMGGRASRGGGRRKRA